MFVYFFFLASVMCVQALHAAGALDDAARLAAQQVDDAGRVIVRSSDDAVGAGARVAGSVLESGQAGAARELEREVLAAQAQANKTVLQTIQDTARSVYKWVFGVPGDVVPVSAPVVKISTQTVPVPGAVVQSSGVSDDLAQVPARQVQKTQNDLLQAHAAQANTARHALGLDSEGLQAVSQEVIEHSLDTAVELQKKAVQKQIAKSQAGQSLATGSNAQKDQDAD